MKPIDSLPAILASESRRQRENLREASAAAGIRLDLDETDRAALELVCAFSNFAARSCIRHPAMLADLIDSGDLRRRYDHNGYRIRIPGLLSGIGAEADLSRRLRRFRTREMIRIAWRDLAGWAGLTETMANLSDLADACLHRGLMQLYQEACDRHGTPIGGGRLQPPLVVALGKLGGRELNFSSDIDLIFAYPRAGHTGSMANEQFFADLFRRLLSVLNDKTPDGFVFRVDLRLRPYGESGPIVMNFDNMEDYYQHQGREWERYAWIKARIAAGDRAAGRQLLTILKPFVYRRYLDYGTIDALREMKQEIALEVKRRRDAANIKLGAGGIREIEFFGQIFQLIRGGLQPALQTRSILDLLPELARAEYVPRPVCGQMLAAYRFLRKVENRLQAQSDRQTHQLPKDDVGRLRVAAAMGFTDWSSFFQRLQGHMSTVHHHFSSLLEGDAPQRPNGRRFDRLAPLNALWLGQSGGVSGRDPLTALGYRNPPRVTQLLDDLRNHQHTRNLSRKGRQRLDRLIPLLIEAAGGGDDAERVLQRLIDLIKQVESRTCYLALLLENPSTLDHLVRLVRASPWISSFVARHPLLLDELLDPRTLYAPPPRTELESDLRRRFDMVAPDDLENQLEALNVFKQVNTLRVAAADVTGFLPLMRVSDYLTDIAETALDRVVRLSWHDLVEQLGRPAADVDLSSDVNGFVVLAYGKLGGIELGYGSDLDLVFLHAGGGGQTRGGRRSADHGQFYARLGQRVIHMLSARTRAGYLYEIDMRLRPSGSSGVLVSSIEGFAEYQLQNAWTWEHQALVRARVASGDPLLADRFHKIRRRVLSRRRRRTQLQADVGRMRDRLRRQNGRRRPGIFDLKQDRGGMVDIEFLVQYLVLLNAHRHPALLEWTDNVRLLRTLAASGIIDTGTAHLLREAYLAYRSAAHRLSLEEKAAEIENHRFQHLRRRIGYIWDAHLGG